MPKKSRPAPRYASRYESLRPFLRFLAWGCWHKTEFAEISGKSARSYEDGLARARLFLPKNAFIETKKGRRSYITLRGDAYYGCDNFLVNSYRMKALPPLAAFYTVLVLQILGKEGRPLTFDGFWGTDGVIEGEYPAILPDGDLNDSYLHDTLESLRDSGYIEMRRENGEVNYRLRKNPLADLTKDELSALLAAVGFYKNVAAVSVVGYQLEAALQNLYAIDQLPSVPAQFRSIAFDRVLDDEILHAALEALRLGKALRFLYREKERLAFPLRVVTDFASGGRQYLEAREKGASIVFSYRLDRITDISLTEDEPPADPPKTPPPVRFVVSFHLADGDREALRARILKRSPHISVVSEEEDALLCAVEDAEPLRFFPWLRGFQPRAEILDGPDGLRARMRDNIKEALQNYGCSVQ